MKKRVLALVLACALALSLTGCRAKGPEDTLKAFEKAFNSYDLDGMLNCVDSTMATLIRAFIDMEAKEYSLNHTLIFALVKMGFPLLPALTDGVINKDDLPKLSLDCGAATVDGDKASVPVNGSLSVGKSSFSFRVTVKLKRNSKNKWLISGLEKAESLDEKLAA